MEGRRKKELQSREVGRIRRWKETKEGSKA
jgi:hypothetical protein